MNVLEIVFIAAAAPFLAVSAYLSVLTACSRRGEAPRPGPAHLFFDVIVPAHDEGAYIEAAVSAILAIDYPRRLFRVVVVADNCTDETAARAAAAGATVLVRDDPTRSGKGHALELAFRRSLQERRADAVVVLDADAIPSANLLRAFSARLEKGTPAVQSDCGVLNPDASWRTGLMRVALATFVTLRSLGRERLGLSAGLHGTGMCFAARTLLEVPFQPVSNVEDLEYALRLGRAGLRVHFAGEAMTATEMTTSSAAARLQRERWEGGRRRLARSQGLPLLVDAVAQRSALLFDLALDLLTPPLARLVAAVGLGTAASALFASRGGPRAPTFAWGVCALLLSVYVLRGWVLSERGARGLLDLARAPFYMVWKAGTVARGAGSTRWIRTPRERDGRGGRGGA